jgi:hypothetical protein
VVSSASDHRVIPLESLNYRMADNKSGRDKQADDADRRQRERDVAAELERGDDPEPPLETGALAEFETALEDLDYPATGSEVVTAIGDREVESPEGSYRVTELIPDTDAETFDSPVEVQERVRRPTAATAMKRIAEASESLADGGPTRSQRDAYERTFAELAAIDAVDDDEGIPVIADWIVERIREKEKLPSSRGVRREAAKYCRSNASQVRNDEWLGV